MDARVELVHLPRQGSAVPPNYTDILREVCQMVGVDHAAYGAVIPGTDAIYSYATYPEEWIKVYAERRFQEVDPSLMKVFSRITPLDWSTLAGDPHFQAICAAGAEFGVPSNGVTIPVRGPGGDTGMLAFSKQCSAEEWARIMQGRAGTFMLYAAHFHDNVISQVFNEDVAPTKTKERPTLDAREIEVLRAVSECGKPQEAASNLGVALRTIEAHLRTIRIRLRALTNGHAVIRAKALEII